MPFPADHLAQLQETMRQAHVRHAARPAVRNGFELAYAQWRTYYEAKAALADQNPAFAAKLLPVTAPVAPATLGFPVLPAGVQWQVDTAGPHTLTVTVNITGQVVWNVLPPASLPALTPTPTVVPTQQAVTVDAAPDGLYRVSLRQLSTQLAALYVPVQRARFLDFRELSRFQRFDFKNRRNPAASENYSELLAVLYACDAAAATGQPALFADLAAIADELPKAPHPIALRYDQ